MIETDRLYLRPFNSKDDKFLYELNNNRMVNQYLSFDSMPVERCQKWICHWIADNEPDSLFGVFVVALKAEGRAIGLVFLRREGDRKEAEIGYRLLPKYWGKGCCSEIVKKLITSAFIKTDTERIYAETHPENERSVKFLKRLGFIEEVNTLKGRGRIFCIDRNSWPGILG